MQRKRKISFRKSDEWLIKLINEIVETKKRLGFKTTFSYEMVRLAKKGMIDSKDGHKIDRMVLNDDSKKST